MDPIKFDKPNIEVFKSSIHKPDIIEEAINKITEEAINKIIEEYNRDIKEAVATLDINNLKIVVEAWDEMIMYPYCFELPNDEVLEITIRKMAVNMLNIPDKVKEEAKEWLLARGYALKLE